MLVVSGVVNLLKKQTLQTIQCLYQAVIVATVQNREYNFNSGTEPHYKLYFIKAPGIFLIPPLLSYNSSSLICCLPLSVLSYQSVPH